MLVYLKALIKQIVAAAPTSVEVQPGHPRFENSWARLFSLRIQT